ERSKRRRGSRPMTDKTNMSQADVEAELRRAFDRLLLDIMKGDSDVSAAHVEAIRKRIHDLDEDRRWAAERAENEDLKSNSKVPEAVSSRPADKPWPFVNGVRNPDYDKWMAEHEPERAGLQKPATEKQLPNDVPFMASE